jgi:hypothetical protein
VAAEREALMSQLREGLRPLLEGLQAVGGPSQKQAYTSLQALTTSQVGVLLNSCMLKTITDTTNRL